MKSKLLRARLPIAVAGLVALSLATAVAVAIPLPESAFAPRVLLAVLVLALGFASATSILHGALSPLRGTEGHDACLSVQLALERRLNERSSELLRELDEKARARETVTHLEEQLRQAVKMEAVGRLAGGVAHDFNNLLTAILGHTQLLLKRMPGDDALVPVAREIQRAGERAAGLTRQLLVFSRKQTVAPRPVDLNQVVANLDRMLRRLIGEDIELLTTLQRDAALVCVDPGQIEQVIVNLVVNARDAMPAGGRLSIGISSVAFDPEQGSIGPTTGAGAGHAMLTVRDTGCGMDGETLRHLFEPFFTTKSEGKGTGLGLSTAYGIVKQYGGHIEVDSAPGRGSTFRVVLPKAEGVAAGEDAPVETGNAGARGHETVLVVEDDPLVRQLAVSILRQEGYRVIEADGPESAMTAARTHAGAIDLVVTDVVLPRMNGCELAERLLGMRPGLRALFMSGYGDAPQRTGAVPLAGRPFLQKPFRPHDLARSVREVLEGCRGSGGGAQPPPIHLAN